MSLDNLIQTADQRASKPELSSLALFADSLHYELHQSAYGLAQTVGLQDQVGKMEAPAEATSFGGQNAQIIGRGVASFLPTIGVALAAKFGLAKVLERSKAAENILLKPSALGFSVIESAGTGLATGALLKPTDDKVASDWSSFALDRAAGGLTGALSFGTLTVATFGLSKLAQTRALTGIGADRVLTSAVGSGLISGAAGGLINVQTESLLNEGKFTTDGAKIGKSMYEMAVVGGLFGATTSGLAMLGRVQTGAAEKGAALEMRETTSDPQEALAASLAGNPEQLGLVKELLPRDAGPEALTLLPQLERLAAAFRSAPQTMERILQLHNDGVSLSMLNRIIDPAPEIYAPIVQAELNNPNINLELLRDPEAFRTLVTKNSLKQYFSNETVLARLLIDSGAHQPTVTELGDLVRFVANKPTTRPAMIEQLLASGAPNTSLRAKELQGMVQLIERFGGDSDLIEPIKRLPGLDAAKLFAFLEEGSGEESALAEKLVRAGASAEELKPYRLYWLGKLNDAFGEDSPVMKRIVALEAEGLDLNNLYNFSIVGGGKSLVEQLVLDGAGVEQLSSKRLTGLAYLNTIFGAESATVEKLIKLEPNGLQLQSIAGFIEGLYGSTGVMTQSATRDQARRSLIEKELANDAPAQHFDTDRLLAILELNGRLGEDSTLLENVRKMETDNPKLLSELGRFLGSDFNSASLVEQLLKQGATVQQLSLENLAEFKRLFESLTPSGSIVRRVLELESQGFNLPELSVYLKDNQWCRQIVETLIQNGASAEQLGPEKLSGRGVLAMYLGQSSAYLNSIVNTGSSEFELERLAQFVCSGGAKHIELLKRVIDKGGDAFALSLHRLKGLSAIDDAFGVDSNVKRQLLALESQGLSIDPFRLFLSPDKDLTLPKFVVEQMLAESLQPSFFNWGYMKERLYLTQTFGSESPYLKNLLDLQGNGLALTEVAHFLQACPKNGILLLKGLLDQGATVKELAQSRLEGLATLENMLDNNKEAMQRLLELEKQGVDLKALSRFVEENTDVNLPLLQDALERGFTAKQLNVANLHDRRSLSLLSKRFRPGSDVMNYLDQLQTQGLNMSRLAQYVEESPDTRQPVVERLVKEKADIDRFNDQSKLLVFPDHVAERLVEAARNGGLSAAQLLGHLRQWQSGRYFLELVTDQVESGRSLAPSDMQVLAQQSKAMAAAHSDRAVFGELIAPDSPDAGMIASTLTLAAERIDQVIPKDRPIVLLGRDMGPVLPLLRARGREAQYFLWSTIQGTDTKTIAQWRKEIPPNAAVVDTGYSGTVIDFIWQGDTSISGYLLSKNVTAGYPQLLPEHSDHRNRTGQVEDLAKLIGRASSYTANGGARARTGQLDGSDVAAKNQRHSGKSRFVVERELREIFRQAGLPNWDAWRYSQFVGLTPKERLGLNTGQEVAEHYKRIEQLRQTATTKP